MYRISKDKGHNQNITLTNVEKKTSIIIGKLTMGILSILEKEVKICKDKGDDTGIKIRDAWDFTVSDEAGKALSLMTSPIKKPIRNQSKKSEQTQPIQKTKTKSGREVVDVFDLIFGTN